MREVVDLLGAYRVIHGDHGAGWGHGVGHEVHGISTNPQAARGVASEQAIGADCGRGRAATVLGPRQAHAAGLHGQAVWRCELQALTCFDLGGGVQRLLRGHAPLDDDGTAHVWQGTQRDDKRACVRVDGARAVGGIKPAQLPIAAVGQRVPAALCHVADDDRGALWHGVDEADVAQAAGLGGDIDARALRGAQQAGGWRVADGLGACDRAVIERQQAVGVVNGANVSTTQLERASRVGDGPTWCAADVQRARQHTAGQL